MVDRKNNSIQVENKMGTQSVKWLLFSMSFPPMISMIVAALYNIVDSIFVAKISEKSLTALTIAFPVQMLMVSILVGTGVGLASLISRRLGEKRQAEADMAVTHGIALGLLCYIAFLIFGLFISPIYVKSFTDDPLIISQTVLYLRIVMSGSITICISIPIERILQATGNTLAPMIFNISGAAINSCLAPIFIIGLFGMPRLNVLGAGLVAVFGQSIALSIALILFHKGKHLVHIDFKHFKFHMKIVKDIYVVAIPTIILMSITSVMLSIMNIILMPLSHSAVAVLGVYFRIQQFVFMPIFGMCQGALPLMGYNYGAKKKERFVKIYKSAIVVSILIMATGMVLFQLLPDKILLLFSAKDSMMEIGIDALRTISLGFLPAGFCIVTIAVFQALAHGTAAMLTSILRQLVCIIPLAYIFAKTLGLDAVWFSFPIAELVAFTFVLFYFMHIYKTQIKKLDDINTIPV
ncbi:MAG: MATE family efflux transporter [Clostridiales Family XIII bacterium]|nr:MATE family efflux transporter [Clostridiales Family XIII bacterium]